MKAESRRIGAAAALAPAPCAFEAESPVMTVSICRPPDDGLGRNAPAGLLARGSWPFLRLPGPFGPVALAGTLSAYSCGGSCGFGIPVWVLPDRIPVSSPSGLARRGE